MDTLSYGGGKRVEAFGSGGDDHLTGGAQIDLLAGGEGTDKLVGGKGGDEIYGDAGADVLNGVAGQRDDLQGGTGADTLLSSGHGDILIGCSSPLPRQNGVWGGDDPDQFKFTAAATGTAQKWRKRTTVSDRLMGPAEPHCTALSIEHEAMSVAFRRHSLLPLDDCL